MWWLEETMPNFKGLNMSLLNTDEAWINISSFVKEPLWIYILSEDCHTCSYKKFLDEPILQNHSYKAIANTRHGVTFRLQTSGEFNVTPSTNCSLRICDVQAKLGEFGVYSLMISKNGTNTPVQCSLTSELEPVNIFLPFLATVLFWLIVGLIVKFSKKHWRSIVILLKTGCLKTFASFSTNGSQHEEEETSILAEDGANRELVSEPKEPQTSEGISIQKARKRKKAATKKNEPGPTSIRDISANRPSSSSSIVVHQSNVIAYSPQKERLMSLDAFRGLCIIIMIFADDGGGGYYFFQHSTWDGLYVADLAFPWFVWICGSSIPYSMNSKFAVGASKLKVLKEVMVRSVKLILLGIMVNTSTTATAVQLEYLRLPGVLQRFGICYFIGSCLVAFFYDAKRNPNNESMSNQQHLGWKDYVKGSLFPWCIVLFCVGLHTSLIFLLPVPNCPSGYLGPAGLHNNSAWPPSCVGGAAGYIDRLIFGTRHIHNRPTSSRVYGSGAFDPEGVLGILTSVLHIWLGIEAGNTMLTYKSVETRTIRLLFWSIICGIGGFILCGGMSNSGCIPVNKNVWSLSFVLVTSSAAFAILLLMYLVIDVKQLWNGSPLMETGRNSIFLYLSHEVCHAMIPWHFSYGRMATHTSKLMETCWGSAIWITIAVYLHDRQLFFVV